MSVVDTQILIGLVILGADPIDGFGEPVTQCRQRKVKLGKGDGRHAITSERWPEPIEGFCISDCAMELIKEWWK